MILYHFCSNTLETGRNEDEISLLCALKKQKKNRMMKGEKTKRRTVSSNSSRTKKNIFNSFLNEFVRNDCVGAK
jgi:hypothetical protein